MSHPGGGAGAVPTRRQARWERFRVTHPYDPGTLAGLVGLLVAVLAIAVLLGWGLGIRGGQVIILTMPFIVFWFENRRTAFQFDAGGVRVSNVKLPWRMVAQLVVATPEDRTNALLGVRLRQGATLPPGADIPPADPAMPAKLYVTVQNSKVDLNKMADKARKYAPPQIQIVLAEPAGERVLYGG